MGAHQPLSDGKGPHLQTRQGRRHEESEFRSPDPACNPYLAFAVMIAAGLKGIEGKYRLTDPVEEDIFEMSEEEREKAGLYHCREAFMKLVQNAMMSPLVRETWVITYSSSLLKTRKKNGMRSGLM